MPPLSLVSFIISADIGGPLADNTTSGRYTSHGWKQEVSQVTVTGVSEQVCFWSAPAPGIL